MLLEKKKKIGMRDIAEAAGVSVTVVSSALSGGGRISEERKHEITQLAHKMGYRSNAAARLLKSKRVEDVGLLIFEKEELIRENAAFMDMTIQFLKECLRNNIHFQLEWFDSYSNRETVPQILTNGLVGGLLIAGVPTNASKHFIDQELTLPYVTLGERSAYSICYDRREQLRQAIYYLVSLGHTDIGLINGPIELKIFQDCKEVYDSTLKEISQFSPSLFCHEYYPAEDTRSQTTHLLEKFLNESKRPTALLVQSGLFCKSFISGLFRNGVKVPEDVSIICIETVDWEAEKFYPPITAIEHHFHDMVATGVKMLCDLMSGKKVDRPNQTVLPVFTKRETVAPYRSNLSSIIS